MKNILDRYLDRVLIYANKPESEFEAVRKELKDHLMQKVDDLVRNGLPREEATLEALRQHGAPKVIGYRLRGPFPWIDIRSHGTARGVIAIGPRAVGIFAFGGVAIGVFACGGTAVGLFSAGGFALGLLLAWGGFGIGGMAYAALAIGVAAVGGLAIGVVAASPPGGFAIGAWVPYYGLYGRGTSGAISHYTAENVPPLLKYYLVKGFKLSTVFYHYSAIIILVYILAIFALCFLQYREGKRVRSEADWLIDG